MRADTVAVTEAPGAVAGLDGLSASQRQQAMERFAALRPHIKDGITLAETTAAAGVPLRTACRWLAAHRHDGLAGLVRNPRRSKGQQHFPKEKLSCVKILTGFGWSHGYATAGEIT